MVNYYKEFPKFKEQYQANKELPQKDIPLDIFVNNLMRFFGFGGRHDTIDRWCTNFRAVGFISIERNKSKEIDICDPFWEVNFIED